MQAQKRYVNTCNYMHLSLPGQQHLLSIRKSNPKILMHMYMSELKYTAYPDFGDMCIREVYFKGPTIYEVAW